jgi:hypothetical protein
VRQLDACPLCRSTLAPGAQSCSSCGADLTAYYDLARLTSQYLSLAREMLSRGEVDGAREIISRLPSLSGVDSSEMAELTALLALVEGRYAEAAQLAGQCEPARAEQLLSEAEVGLERQRRARESYNYGLTAARDGAYSAAADYLRRAAEEDPHEAAIWQLKLKVDLKARRYFECYRDLAALDRLNARPHEFLHLEALLPPVQG